jgi:hypothetical protein
MEEKLHVGFIVSLNREVCDKVMGVFIYVYATSLS